MHTLKDFDFKEKKVLVRCDFNVPLSDKGEVLEDFRLKETLPTIKYLIEKGGKIILMSHLGRPEGKFNNKFSLKPIAKKLGELLAQDVRFLPDCQGERIKNEIEKMKPGEVVLLENLRFYKGEEENDSLFAKSLAELGDIYINEAFSASHRDHASIVGIAKYLPSGAGFLLEKEINILSGILENPKRPMIVIIGGIKIGTKIKLIERFLDKADHLLLGGEMAHAILTAKQISIGKPLPEKEVVEEIKKIDLTNPKLHLPTDCLISLEQLDLGLREGYLRIGNLGSVKKDEEIYDIGPETIKIFSKIIRGGEVSFWKGPLEYIKQSKAPKTILWNGPLGFFENEKFAKGTKEIAEVVSKIHSAFKIVGGGDTITALTKFGLLDKFDHVCTGGGAMLEFLSGKELPGIKALEN